MGNALQTYGLSKTYRNGVEALKGVSLEVKEGELMTIIGPNGAGKTTLIRILTTQLLPSSGRAEVLGHDVVQEAEEVRKHISLVPQEATTYSHMTPWDWVYYLTRLEGVSSKEAERRAEMALQRVKLYELRRRPCYQLSGGERRRVIVAAALASGANILFLDEPTTGLDPIVRREVWRSLREVVEEGRTIVLTTHMMEEAEMVSDRIAVINRGRVLFQGTPAEIKSMVPAKARVVVRGNASMDLERFGEVVSIADREIVYVNDAATAAEVVKESLQKGLKAEVSSITLEDVFIKLVGEASE